MQLRHGLSALLMVCLVVPFASADWMLIHHYKLDETTGTTAEDSVGTANGTLTGNVDFSFDDDAMTGQDGGALDFTRSEVEKVELGLDTLSFGTSDFKISMWIKRDSVSSGRNGLWGQNSADSVGDHSAWARIQDDNTILFLIDKGTGSGSTFTVSSGAITDTSNWHYVEFGREFIDASTGTNYWITVDTTTYSGIDSTGSYDISGAAGSVFGAYISGTTSNTFDGGIDDVRIYGVPEPSSLVLLGVAMVGLLGLRSRSR